MATAFVSDGIIREAQQVHKLNCLAENISQEPYDPVIGFPCTF